MTVSTDLHLKT